MSLHVLREALRRQQIHPKRSALMDSEGDMKNNRCSQMNHSFYLLKLLVIFDSPNLLLGFFVCSFNFYQFVIITFLDR